MLKWLIIGLSLIAISCIATGVYFILSPNDDSDGRMLLRQLRPDLLNEQQLKDKLQVIHPTLDPGKQSRYQLYVTPSDDEVVSLAGELNGATECYQSAVQWTWVSDPTLHGTDEKWLTPHEFLSDTPAYDTNPVKPAVASDCEEQANTLVSLLRADGIPATDVRVVLGMVDFGGEVGGHAWVEIKQNLNWMPLEATSGPYWDDDANRLVSRSGHPFNYYSRHNYPEIEVWAYYNDVYYLDPRDNSGNAPLSWRKLQFQQ